MSSHDEEKGLGELKSPEERRELIEALHEKAHGKNSFDDQVRAFQVAAGGRRDKTSVLKAMTQLLGVKPIETDGTYTFDKWEVRFDKNDNLQSMSASSGEPGMIRAIYK